MREREREQSREYTSKIETFATASDDAATDKQVAPRPSTRYVAKKFRPKREQKSRRMAHQEVRYRQWLVEKRGKMDKAEVL